MKKVISILLTGLLIWNVVLTSQLSESQERIETLENRSTVIQSPNAQTDPNRVTVIDSETNDIQDVYEQVSPAVVTIMADYRNLQISTGSGVIYASDSDQIWIVTNNHVIEDGDNYRILFHNQEVVEATLIGADAISDLAVLTANIDFELTPITIGDSSAVETGQTVLALGSPGGENFANTVTKGIVSGTNRTISVDLDGDFTNDWDMVLIQTDAAINPGNSGGALVNLNGELIGINTIKIAQDAYEGMGFAIPSNEVVNIISQLETSGEVSRPTLGVSVYPIDALYPHMRQRYNIIETSGLYVNSVMANSPAQQAGIQAGDIIQFVDGEEITSFSQFRRVLYSQQIGDSLVVELIRNDETISVTVTL